MFAIFILVVCKNSAASDVAVSIEKPTEIEKKEIRVIGGIFFQSGNSIGDGYAGESRDVNSDYGAGIRIGSGVSWPHYMISLNCEYLKRKINASVAPTIASAPPAVNTIIEYSYLKLQPEISIKTHIYKMSEIGAIGGLGLRYKMKNDRTGASTQDKSIVLGLYGQFRGVNLRVSKELFYQCSEYTESTNTSIGLSYSHGFTLN